jgi:epsilon-lactone hydrolase
VLDEDGTLHIRDLTLPWSELCTPEFRSAFVRLISAPEREVPAAPSRRATRSEWDAFDARLEALHVESIGLAARLYPVDVQEDRIAGVRVWTLAPKDGLVPKAPPRVLVSLHGGGFVYGRGRSIAQLEASPVAAIGKIKVIALDYRQAPFHEFPAATDDVEKVYRALLDEYLPGSIGLLGCSAGAALVAQALARFQTRKLPRPGAAGIFSSFPPTAPWPWGRRGDSRIWASGLIPRTELTDAEKSTATPVTWYMENAQPEDAEAYPGSFDEVLAGFPPTLLLAGTREYSMSPAVAAHARLLKLGVDSSIYVMEGAWHGAHVFAVGTPEAHDAQANIARWFLEHLTE